VGGHSWTSLLAGLGMANRSLQGGFSIYKMITYKSNFIELIESQNQPFSAHCAAVVGQITSSIISILLFSSN
jgi:hypothetical protein